MTPSLLYRILKVYCSTALRFYFSTWQINNVNAIPRSGPVIFIPNHQNAFLDAILVICSSPRNPWSIARASVFKEGWVTRLLTAIQIKPVFRIRDGWSSLRNNDAIIQEWSDMLTRGQDILIFAEGNHNEPYAAGLLQKGFARMAIQFQQKDKTPLTIIPIGFHYEDHYAFRSRVLVNFGEPIHVDKILDETHSDREKLETLVAVTDSALKKLALAIPADASYASRAEFLMRYRTAEKDMIAQLSADKELLRSYPNPPVSSARKKKTRHGWQFLNPIVWVGYLLHVLPYTFIRQFIGKKVKDPQFISSLKYALGIFLVPAYYAILLIAFYLFIPHIAALLIFAVALPLTGIVATDLLKRS